MTNGSGHHSLVPLMFVKSEIDFSLLESLEVLKQCKGYWRWQVSLNMEKENIPNSYLKKSISIT